MHTIMATIQAFIRTSKEKSKAPLMSDSDFATAGTFETFPQEWVNNRTACLGRQEAIYQVQVIYNEDKRKEFNDTVNTRKKTHRRHIFKRTKQY